MSSILPHLSTLPVTSVLLPPVAADGWEQARGGRTLSADVVIVGTGPGGAAVALTLAEAGLSVLLLEEGPASSNFRPNQAHTARYHMQEGGAMVARGEVFVPIAAGRGVGGGSLINSALCFRPSEQLFIDWEALLGPAWSPEVMFPIYDELAELIGVGMTPPELAGRNNQIIADGVAKLGWEGGLAPRSTPGCKGCGVCNYGCPSGGKASMNLTLLPRAQALGARIQADVKVNEIRIEGGRAVGVKGVAFHPDTGEAVGDVVVRARHVVLAAGAIGTPRLLWSAGLGETLGPVGEGLHLHPGSAVMGICDEPVYLWRGASQGAYFVHPELPGVLPHTLTAPPEVLLLTLGAVGPRLQEGLKLLPYLCGILFLVSDKGSGRVRAFSDGRADITYGFDPRDLAVIKKSLLMCAQVMLAGGARELLSPIHGVGRHTRLDTLEAALTPRTLADFTMYSAHPMATCRMGRDEQTSVLGPDGEAHHLPGLTVADASVFPTSLGVNPQLTTLAVATRIARQLAEKLGSQ